MINLFSLKFFGLRKAKLTIFVGALLCTISAQSQQQINIVRANLLCASIKYDPDTSYSKMVGLIQAFFYEVHFPEQNITALAIFKGDSVPISLNLTEYESGEPVVYTIDLLFKSFSVNGQSYVSAEKNDSLTNRLIRMISVLNQVNQSMLKIQKHINYELATQTAEIIAEIVNGKNSPLDIKQARDYEIRCFEIFKKYDIYLSFKYDKEGKYVYEIVAPVPLSNNFYRTVQETLRRYCTNNRIAVPENLKRSKN